MAGFTDNSDKILAKVKLAVKDAVKETAVQIIHDMAESMAQTKHGRMYGTHQASAPGESPAIDTADLVNSLTDDVIDNEGLVRAVGSTDRKSIDLEFGTFRFEPRPFLTPAVEKEKPELPKRIKQNLA